MTLNQIVSDIRNIATSGSNPIDFRIEDAQLRFWIHEIRSMLISQAIQKRQDTSDIWIQTVSCMELELVDSSECCEIETDCPILRTVNQLPATIEVSADNSILRVSDPMGNTIPRTTPFASRYDKYNKYTKDTTKWYQKNRYIYIINNEYLENINVDIIAEDPTSLASFTNCGGSTCYNDNGDYPCSLKMANDITNIILKTKVFPFLQLPQDNTNNASNESQSSNIKG